MYRTRNGARWLVCGLLAAALGVLVGWHQKGDGPPLVLETPLIDLSARPIIEGERVEVTSTLVNRSGSPVTLVAMPSSCGCMAVESGEGPRLPRVLAPGERFPIRLVIHTAGQGGLKNYQVTVLAKSQSGSELSEATLRVVARIYAALRAHPDYFHVVIPDREAEGVIEREVSLLDQWGEGGLELARIHSTAGQRLEYSLRKGEGELRVGAAQLTRRHVIRLRLRPKAGEKAFREEVVIQPADARVKPVTVTIEGRIAFPLSFTPEALVFFATGPGQRHERTAEFTFEDPADGEIELASAPAGYTVRFGPRTGGRREVHVAWNSSSPGRQTYRLVFRVGARRKELELGVDAVVEPIGAK